MRKLPSKVTVQIDRRENYPLPFPSTIKWYPNRGSKPRLIQVETEVKTLPTGDYLLKGYDDVSIFEKKGSIAEVAQNMLTKDYSRASSAFQRLIEACEFPYLLLNCPVESLWEPTQWVPEPARAFQALTQMAAERRLPILMFDARSVNAQRRLGEVVLTYLLTHAFHEEVGPIDIQEIVNATQSGMDDVSESGV